MEEHFLVTQILYYLRNHARTIDRKRVLNVTTSRPSPHPHGMLIIAMVVEMCAVQNNLRHKFIIRVYKRNTKCPVMCGTQLVYKYPSSSRVYHPYIL